MTIFLATLTGLVLWIVLWGIDFASGFDAFMLTMLIILGGVIVHVVRPYLPGNRRDELPPPGA